jgi:rhodanese-related sulfurtransferase
MRARWRCPPDPVHVFSCGVIAMKVHHKTPFATLLVAAGLLMPGFATAQKAPEGPKYPPSISKMVADTKKQISTITMDEFKSALDKKDAGLVIDVRTEYEVEDGYVPGAVNIPRGLIEFRIWKELGFPKAVDMNAKLTLYCGTSGRATMATKTLKDLGFTHVTAVNMKFDDWVKAGYPVDKPKKH